MHLTIGLTDGPINTRYAPLVVLAAVYRAQGRLKPLSQVQIAMKTREFSPADKFFQVLLSMLAGCQTLSEVNTHLKSEVAFARACGWPRFADQSTLSRLLDGLSLKQIEALRRETTTLWKTRSRTMVHDWRGYLWLDFDVTGLPCSSRAEASQRGYFSGKKTSQGVN